MRRAIIAGVHGLEIGEDGHPRCAWGASGAEYRAYHDDEWGRPVRDEQGLLERLCLEGFQSGLSWLTILRKRDAFRRAFADFVPERVAAFGPAEIARLLGDAGIVRHRGKIEATIANARATIALHETGESLVDLIWAHRADGPPPRTFADVPAITAASTALSRDLKRRGFRFVGPTTCYAAMQAVGVVNDHLDGCHARASCEAARTF